MEYLLQEYLIEEKTGAAVNEQQEIVNERIRQAYGPSCSVHRLNYRVHIPYSVFH